MHKLGGKNKYQNNYMLSKFLWVEKKCELVSLARAFFATMF